MISAYKKLNNITISAVIAALYVILTYFSSIFGLAFFGIQFRISEVLTILPILTPAAIPGLTIGCFIANLSSPLGIIDIIFGTFSTLLCSILTRMLRKIEFKKLPLLAMAPPVIIGAAFVAVFIMVIFPENISSWAFLGIFIPTFISQAIICYGFGIPLLIFLRKINKTNHIF